MRLIGYWIRSLRDAEYLPPQEFVGPLPDEVRRAVADYVDRGTLFAAYRGTSWCRFFCGRQMGHSELTDGRWVWPVDLGHYVRDHGVVLPAEFVDQALSGGSGPAVSGAGPPTEPDATYWIAWCRENRSGRYRETLAEAKRRADREAERLWSAAVAERESKEGVSTEPCRWAGCGNRALAGKVFCAACCLRGSEWIADGPYDDLRRALVSDPGRPDEVTDPG